MNQMKMILPLGQPHFRRALPLIALLVALFAVLGGSVSGNVPAPSSDDQSMVGSYTREFSGAGGTVTETLEIKPDKTVTWTTNYPGKPPLVQTGIWNVRSETLVVVLDKRDGEKMPAQERVVFDRKGKELKGRIYDKNVHGNSGLVFHRSS